MSEEEFKKSTPAKLFKLLSIHQEINNPDSDGSNNSGNKRKPGVEEKYIDQINF